MNNLILKNNYYSILALQTAEEGKIQADILLSKKHPIHEGHFPEMAVVPGVCILQIIREIISEVMERKLYIVQISEIKYLVLIRPFEDSRITIDITCSTSGDKITGAVRVSAGDKVFVKVKGLELSGQVN